MVDKRAKKLKSMLKDIPKPIIYNSEAKKLIIVWGSVVGAVIESGLKNYAILHLKTLWPINEDLTKIINAYKDITVIENNGTSQLTTLLKSQFNFNPTKVIVKYDGRPLFPEEIYEQLK
jgi:2-oxoglutarate ferredoxin oxidoreductase subunit alpha